MQLSHLPNLITILRLVLLVPFLFYILQEKYSTAFIYFFLAGFSDALDGFLARYFKWTSKFGALLDPLADKALMLTSFSALAWLGHIPIWLFCLVVARDLIIMGGVGMVLLICGSIEYKPTFISKVNTVLQIFFVLTMLFGLAIVPVPHWLIPTIMWPMVMTTIGSVMIYVWLGVKQALNAG